MACYVDTSVDPDQLADLDLYCSQYSLYLVHTVYKRVYTCMFF